MLLKDHKALKKIVLRPGERVEGIARQHVLALSKQILIASAVILVDIFFMLPLFQIGAVGVSVFLAIFITALIYVLREFLMWSFNIFIITSQRVIDIHRQGFFKKVVSQVPYHKVGDVSYSVKGPIQTILKLGTVQVESAQSQNTMILFLENVKAPEKVSQVLHTVISEFDPKTLIKPDDSPELVEQEKESAKAKFLGGWSVNEGDYNQEIQEYDNYNLKDLVRLYRDTFDDIELKKLLVDELIDSGVEAGEIIQEASKKPAKGGKADTEFKKKKI